MQLEVLQHLTFEFNRSIESFEDLDVELTRLLLEHHFVVTDEEKAETGDCSVPYFFILEASKEHEDVVDLVLYTTHCFTLFS